LQETTSLWQPPKRVSTSRVSRDLHHLIQARPSCLRGCAAARFYFRLPLLLLPLLLLLLLLRVR
jgi:hypothetical protein